MLTYQFLCASMFLCLRVKRHVVLNDTKWSENYCFMITDYDYNVTKLAALKMVKWKNTMIPNGAKIITIIVL